MVDGLRKIQRACPAAFSLFPVPEPDDDGRDGTTAGRAFFVTVLHCEEIDERARQVLLLTSANIDGDLNVQLEYENELKKLRYRPNSQTCTLTGAQLRAACIYAIRIFTFTELRDKFEARQLPYLLLPARGATDEVDWYEVNKSNVRPDLQLLWPSGLMDSVTEDDAGLLHDRTILEGTSFAELPLCAIRVRRDVRLDGEKVSHHDGLDVSDVFGRKFKNFPREELVPDQPLLEVIGVGRVEDLLPGGKVHKREARRSRRFIVVPQVCCLGPTSVSMLRACRMVPSIMTEIGRQLLVRFVGTNILRSCVPEQALLLRALTLPHARPWFNYEQLEFFGDCVLKLCSTWIVYCKNSTASEGILTRQRMALIENEHLTRVAERLRIAEYAFGHAPVSKHWRPHGIETDEREQFLWLSDKVLADLIEALLGAAWLCRGTAGERLGRACECVNRLSILPEPIRLGLPDCTDMGLPPYVDMAATPWPGLECLQSLLGYAFRQPGLAIQAMTHASWVQGDLTRSYERLEFLGDAVLEACFGMWVYDRYPGLNEGQYTALKAYATCNNSLAAVCVTLRLHDFLVHSVPELRLRIDTFADSLRTAQSVPPHHRDVSTVRVPFWCFISNVPKQLADVVESILGAVFQDSGFNIDTAQRVFSKLFDNHLATHLSSDLSNVNPSQLGSFNSQCVLPVAPAVA